ncbi:MAG: hypothetical protein ABW223_00590 [Rariglobus sp.]
MSTPDILVRTQHRRLRYTLLVWSLALAVLAVVAAGADYLGWLRHGILIGTPFVATSLGLLVVWLIRDRRLAENVVARDLDTEWQLKARIEASAELSDNASVFAQAQRADAAARLAGRRLPRALAWHSGKVVLIVALLLLAIEIAVVAARVLRPEPAAPLPPEDITASIEWRAPASEIKATSIEEIALAAASSSRTGFRSMSLEVSVNGEPRPSLPLDASTLATLAKPGAHPIKLPLYLDEVAPAEYDIVAYHLRAESASREPSPVVTSPLQFVQIRPAREDVERLKPPPGSGADKIGQLNSMISALKAAQLALLKQNFLLAHAPIAKTEAAWIETNTSVAADQKTLCEKASEARTFAIAEEMDALVVDNLTQVIPLMEDAARLIAETKNEPAARPQGRALGLITELEKLIRKIILEMDAAAGAAGSPPPPKIEDPFKDDQRYKMPPRKSTAAGQLEQLAQDQTEEAKKADPTPSSSHDSNPKPPSADTQAELARRAEELAKNQQLSPAAQQAAAQAARDAAAAAEQLKQSDAAAARAPAHAAASTLRDAAAKQEKDGRDTARAQLEAARRALNDAAAEPDAAKRADKIDAIARQLQADARTQQESGSAEAARQLAAAAAEAAKAAQATRAGADQPGQKPGTEPGAQSGSQPGERLTPDPDGDRELPATGAGKEPGAGPGQEPGQTAGEKSSGGNAPGQQPTAGQNPSAAQTPSSSGSGQGQGQGQGPGQGEGKTPSPRAGSSAASGSGSGSSSGAGSGSGAGASVRLAAADRAAQAAASAQAALSDRGETINRALRQLQRGTGEGSAPSAVPGATPGSGSGSSQSIPTVRPAELILGAQLAHAVLNTPESAQASNGLINSYRNEPKYHSVVMTPELRAAVDHLRVLLAAAASDDRRDETVRRFNPEDLDPAYREVIESYFERLSREARRP